MYAIVAVEILGELRAEGAAGNDFAPERFDDRRHLAVVENIERALEMLGGKFLHVRVYTILELNHIFETFFFEETRRLFATDAASADRDNFLFLEMRNRIELLREFAEEAELGIDSALELPRLDLKIIAEVEDHEIFVGCIHGIEFFCCYFWSSFFRHIKLPCAERHHFFADLDTQLREGAPRPLGFFEHKPAETRVAPERLFVRLYGVCGALERTVHALMRNEHAALEPEFRAQRDLLGLESGGVFDTHELIEKDDGVLHPSKLPQNRLRSNGHHCNTSYKHARALANSSAVGSAPAMMAAARASPTASIMQLRCSGVNDVGTAEGLMPTVSSAAFCAGESRGFGALSSGAPVPVSLAFIVAGVRSAVMSGRSSYGSAT